MTSSDPAEALGALLAVVEGLSVWTGLFVGDVAEPAAIEWFVSTDANSLRHAGSRLATARATRATGSSA
ncbi:MAG: hypothetical protein R3F49_20625 [Planctomycetota bacterium]